MLMQLMKRMAFVREMLQPVNKALHTKTYRVHLKSVHVDVYRGRQYEVD